MTDYSPGKQSSKRLSTSLKHQGIIKLTERRHWTLPDLVLSKTMLLRCGGVDLPWDVLADATEALVMFGFRPERGRLDSGQYENILMANILRQRYNEQVLSLTDIFLLVSASRLFATDPRDVMYSKMAFCSHTEREKIVVDYRIDAIDTYREAAVLMNTQSRAPVSLLLTASRRNAEESAFPSWTPKFDVQTQRLLLAHPASHLDACASLSSLQGWEHVIDYSLLRERHGIVLQGVVVDRLQTVKSYLPPRRICDQYSIEGNNMYSFVEWHEFAERAGGHAGPIPPSDEIHGALLQFAQTIQGTGSNHLWELEGPQEPRDTVAACRQFLEYLQTPGLPETDEIRFFYASCAASHDRRFGVTTSGRFCLVPLDAVAGDSICLIRSLKTPLVLRPTDLEAYTNIGECYVHGIMRGEFSVTDDLEIFVIS